MFNKTNIQNLNNKKVNTIFSLKYGRAQFS